MEGKSVSLVLGSGGARGLAHIGVIRCLEEHGYRIESISGSSMGALIGGIYATGKLSDYAKWVSALEKFDVVRLLDPGIGLSGGIFRGEKIISVLKNLIGEHLIEELPISYTAVAADIKRQREVWIKSGPLFDAIRASIAIPTLFTPVHSEGRTLLDGGLVNPVPIAPTVRDTTDLTIAVDASASSRHDLNTKTTKTTHVVQKEDRWYRRQIDSFLEEIQERFNRDDENQELDTFEVMTGSLETMQSLITRFQLAAYHPDMLVRIPINLCTIYEFYRAEMLINYGYEVMRKKLDAFLSQQEDE